MFGTAWIGDHYHIRGPVIIGNAILTIIGLAMMGWTTNVGAQYAGVFAVCAGANSNIPQCMTWQANNIRGQWKRALCSATLVAFGGIGGIIGSLVFRRVDPVQSGSGRVLTIIQEPGCAAVPARSLGVHNRLSDHRRDFLSSRRVLLVCQQEAGSRWLRHRRCRCKLYRLS